MKKRGTVVLLFMLLMVGCKARELEDRAIPQAFEIKLEDGMLAGGFGEYMPRGNSVQEIISKNQNCMDQYLDLGHIKAIVLGKSLFDEKDRLRQVLRELEEQPLIARSSRIFVYDYGEENSYLKQIAEMGKEPGKYLCDLYKNNPFHSNSAFTLEELLWEEL